MSTGKTGRAFNVESRWGIEIPPPTLQTPILLWSCSSQKQFWWRSSMTSSRTHSMVVSWRRRKIPALFFQSCLRLDLFLRFQSSQTSVVPQVSVVVSDFSCSSGFSRLRLQLFWIWICTLQGPFLAIFATELGERNANIKNLLKKNSPCGFTVPISSI